MSYIRLGSNLVITLEMPVVVVVYVVVFLFFYFLKSNSFGKWLLWH